MQTVELKTGELLLALVLTNAAGVVAKIVWDWLTKRGEMQPIAKPKNGEACALHKEMADQVKSFAQCLADLKSRTIQLEVLLKNHTEYIRDDLSDGKKRFEGIEQKIGAMQQTLAAELAGWGAEIKHLQEKLQEHAK
jgi:phage host-nuclease inhibitor protein Gam